MLALYIILGFITLLALLGVFAPHSGVGGVLREVDDDDVFFVDEADVVEAIDDEDNEDTIPFIPMPWLQTRSQTNLQPVMVEPHVVGWP